MAISMQQATRTFLRDLRDQGIDDDHVRLPNESRSQEFNNGIELRNHKGDLIAFVNENEEVIEADEYLIDHPDRE